MVNQYLVHILSPITARPHGAVGSTSDSKARVPGLDIRFGSHIFVSPCADSRREFVSYWRKYVHEVLVIRLGGLSLPRKSVVN